jgi:hypothetical protein
LAKPILETLIMTNISTNEIIMAKIKMVKKVMVKPTMVKLLTMSKRI